MEDMHILSSFHPLDGDSYILVVRDYFTSEDSVSNYVLLGPT